MTIDAQIHTVRGERVMLDSDLAAVYEVRTGALNQAVDRNERRFPPAFAFRLTDEEWENLKSQSVTSSSKWGGRRKLPRAFTEHGAVMLASVLNSDRAVDASILVVQAFVRMRHILAANQALARRVGELETKFTRHDRTITVIFHELKKLVGGEPMESEMPKGRIGYRTSKDRREKTSLKSGKKK